MEGRREEGERRSGKGGREMGRKEGRRGEREREWEVRRVEEERGSGKGGGGVGRKEGLRGKGKGGEGVGSAEGGREGREWEGRRGEQWEGEGGLSFDLLIQHLFVYLFIAVLLDFTQEAYTVDEDNGDITICVAISEAMVSTRRQVVAHLFTSGKQNTIAIQVAPLNINLATPCSYILYVQASLYFQEI